MGIKLSGELAVFASLEKMGRLATIDRDGTPNTTPVYYAVLDEEIYFGTQKNRQKYKNLVRNPKISFTIDTVTQPYQGLMVQGTAELVSDEAMIKRWHEALMFRYYGHPDSEGWKYIQSLGNPGLVRVNATRFFDWKFG